MEKRISGRTRMLGLMGTPVAHSSSPAMYNYSFEKLGIDYAYLAFEITEEEVPKALDTMRLLNMRGMNVTMPCKQAVAKSVDVLSPEAQIIGAVNTIVNEDGILKGYNTDGMGYVRNLQEHGITVQGKKLTILGAGGAATAIQVQCALEGAKEISIFNPQDSFFKRAIVTAKKIQEAMPNCKVNIYDLADTEKLYEEIKTSDILTNATRAGMMPNENETLISDTSILSPKLVVTDVIYNPKETKLLLDAKEKGCVTIGGSGMLLWQGAQACKLYTGMDMPVSEVQEQFFK